MKKKRLKGWPGLSVCLCEHAQERPVEMVWLRCASKKSNAQGDVTNAFIGGGSGGREREVFRRNRSFPANPGLEFWLMP